MQIVIDISEDAYNYIKANGARIPYYKLTDVIKNGTPLPENHGRLIDADALLVEIECLKRSPWYESDINGSYVVRKEAVGMVEDLCIKKAPTVIEAEKGDKK